MESLLKKSIVGICLVFSCVLLSSTCYAECNSWNLPFDFTDDGANPVIDSCGNEAWLFYSGDVSGYHLMENFLTPTAPDLKEHMGNEFGGEGIYYPVISKNFGKKLSLGERALWPTGTMEFHSGWNSKAVAAWKSPFNGLINLTTIFTDVSYLCGDGVNWSISKNDVALAGGLIPSIALGDIDFKREKLEVATGDMIYVSIDNGGNGDIGCDSVRVSIDIKKSNN